MNAVRLATMLLASCALLAGCSGDSRPDEVKHAIETTLYNTTGCRALEVRNVRLTRYEPQGKDKFEATVDLDLVARMNKADTDKVCNDPDRKVPILHDPSLGDQLMLRWQIIQFDGALQAGKPMVSAGDTVHVSNAELHLFKAGDGWRLAGDHS